MWGDEVLQDTPHGKDPWRRRDHVGALPGVETIENDDEHVLLKDTFFFVRQKKPSEVLINGNQRSEDLYIPGDIVAING
jgi:hypothetical protein